MIFITAPTPALYAAHVVREAEVKISVVIVDDLVPKPVPFTDFSVTTEDGTAVAKFRTDDKGFGKVALNDGTYFIVSAKPLTLKGTTYAWKVKVVIDDAHREFSISDADAATETKAVAPANSEGEIYRAVRNSVVTIETEINPGSGFIISDTGLIMTNQHVTAGGKKFVVRYDRGQRFEAILIAEDATADIAILQVNPTTLNGRKPVKLADLSKSGLGIGDKLLTIGSPNYQEKIMNIGIVSKYEQNAIFANFILARGAGGGPVFNYSGEVVGIATFTDGADPSSPGISGVASIAAAQTLIQKVSGQTSSKLPSEKQLPDISNVSIPIEALQAAQSVELKEFKRIDGDACWIKINTPFYAYSASREYERLLAKKSAEKGKGRAAKGGEGASFSVSPISAWAKYVGGTDALVNISVHPEWGETNRSKNDGVATAVLLGPFGRSKKQFHFKQDIYDCQIKRGETVFEPLRRFRFLTSEWWEFDYAEIKDVSMVGNYYFDPRAFEPGQDVVIQVKVSSDLNKWRDKTLDKKVQERIWNEFAPWRKAAGIN